MVQEPKVIGAVNNSKMLKKYSKYGIDFGEEHSVGTIVGASGILLGLAKARDIDGVCLMGETIGLPMLTDPKAAEKVLQIVTKVLGVKLDLSKIEKAIQEMEDKIKKTEKIHKNLLKEMPKGKEDIRYIG
jgi:proteasome assembly chaperone (PAC2) family protein